jgi:hypothetical protein
MFECSSDWLGFEETRTLVTNAPTVPATIEWIMSQPEFALGVSDARAGRPQHRKYEQWDTDGQWNYERGRAWATLAPRNMALKHAGKVTAQAIAWFGRVNRDIL